MYCVGTASGELPGSFVLNESVIFLSHEEDSHIVLSDFSHKILISNYLLLYY